MLKGSPSVYDIFIRDIYVAFGYVHEIGVKVRFVVTMKNNRHKQRLEIGYIHVNWELFYFHWWSKICPASIGFFLNVKLHQDLLFVTRHYLDFTKLSVVNTTNKFFIPYFFPLSCCVLQSARISILWRKRKHTHLSVNYLRERSNT